MKTEPSSFAPDFLGFFNRQRRVRFSLEGVRRIVNCALPRILEVPGPGERPLESLEHVDCVVVSDRVIRRLHAQFFDDSASTDVITFQHGEIVLCAAVARDAAREVGTSVEQELALYSIHGLLHLNGHDDRNRPGADRMAELQQHILRSALLCAEAAGEPASPG